MIQPDDPRLTSYALGAMDDAERAAFEVLLADDPAARAEVDAIRAFGDDLGAAFAAEPAPRLSEVQRAKVVRWATPPVVPAAPRWYALETAAAGVLVVAGLLVGAVTQFKNALNNAYSKGGDTIQTKITDEIDGYHRATRQSEVDAITVGVLEPKSTRNTGHEFRFEVWNEGTSEGAPDNRRLGPVAGGPTLFGSSMLGGRRENLHQEKSSESRDRTLTTDMELYEEKARELESALALGVDQDHLRRLLKELQEARLLVHGRENDEIRYDHFKTTILDPRSTRIPEILALEFANNDGWGQLTDEQLALLRARLANLDDPSFVRLNALTGPDGAPAGAPRAEYARRHDNPFRPAEADRLSTFAIDVDTAAYAQVRRHLRQQATLPPPERVRIEELVNAFTYDLEPPTGEHPFAATVDAASCPWAPSRRLVRVALKGRELQVDRRPPTNLVFLIDVSGSMADADKLPLVKQALALLAAQLRAEDRVSIVVYAGASGLVLDGAPGDRRADVLAALERLQAGGSTNGGAGVQLAYDAASRHFLEGGVNRVVLCTDGDWNVGLQSREQLDALIAEKATGNVFLSVLGFGMGAYRDDTLERLADRGNGNYAYVDTLAEARKVLVDQLQGTLVTIARDVKVQVEWNPARVRSWRLIGYENRLLAARDFADDTKDAGELGAGHSVTALYEVEPIGAPIDARIADQPLLTLRLRYKLPEGQTSRLLEQTFDDAGRSFGQAPVDLRFAAAVAAFGLVLRDSPHKGACTLALAEQLAAASLGRDPHGQRTEFLELVRLARQVSDR